MKLTIKKATSTDIPQLSILFDNYRIFYKQKSDLALAKSFLTERIQNDESVIFYALSNDEKFVGFIQLYPSFSSVSAKRLWILNDLYVQKEARGSGVATKLMNRAKDFAIETNTKGLSLGTQITNTKAQKLYETLGYEKDEEFYHYFLHT